MMQDNASKLRKLGHRSRNPMAGSASKSIHPISALKGRVYPTFRFHHQPSSVPCMSHVSTPISANVARYVWTRFDSACLRSRYPNSLSANLWGRSASSPGTRPPPREINIPAIIMRMESSKQKSRQQFNLHQTIN